MKYYILIGICLVTLLIGATNQIIYGDAHHVPTGMTPKQYATDLMFLIFAVIPFGIFILGSLQQNEVDEKERNKTRYNNLSQDERVKLAKGDLKW